MAERGNQMNNLGRWMAELDRAFRVLGKDYGFAQNAIDLAEWSIKGIITQNEYQELRKYNIQQLLSKNK